VSICFFLLSSIVLIMRDGEEKVLTTGDIFYNTLSVWQALYRHCRWSHRRSLTSMPTLMPTSRGDYFDDVDIPDIVSRMDLLPLPATNLHCIDIQCRHQIGGSTTIPNALRSMYLLTTALRGMWDRSIGIRKGMIWFKNSKLVCVWLWS
jgi:hypothetical protein